MKKRDGRSGYIARRILDGDDIQDITREEPGYMMLHMGQVVAFKKQIEHDKKRKRDLTPIEWELEKGGIEGHQIISWLNLNVRHVRPFKQKQLYVWSSQPDLGKTGIARTLSETLSVCWWMKWEDFDDQYQDGLWDLLVVDEWKGQRKLQYMNELLQGGQLPLRVKGSQRLKDENTPIIILSNYSPENSYKDVSEEAIATLLTRIEVIELTEFISIKVKCP